VFVGNSAVLARDRFLLTFEPAGPKFRIDRTRALALFKVLRPVPGD
jgi:hypothetical protein